MAKVTAQTYCANCHAVIPMGWPRTTRNGEWWCITCEYEATMDRKASDHAVCNG